VSTHPVPHAARALGLLGGRRLRVLLATLVVGASTLAAAMPADAAIWLKLTKKSGRPGTFVRAQTTISWDPRCCPPMTVYLAPKQLMGVKPKAGRPAGKGFRRVAVMYYPNKKRGPGRLHFTVPKVAPGLYELVVYCPDCMHPNGDHFAASAAFRVRK
jgi:hypothetical protein